MTAPGPLPEFVDGLVRQLRRQGLPLGIDDCLAFRTAVAAGFGYDSTGALRNLCVALWAKSLRDAAIIDAVFARGDVPQWTVDRPEGGTPPGPAGGTGTASLRPGEPDPDRGAADTETFGPPDVTPAPPVAATPPASGVTGPPMVLVPRYPVTEREAVQVWRGLRRARREGPPVELDVDATVNRRCLLGVATPAVLVPARLNTARLVLLVDRGGSMTPYHDYIDHMTDAMRSAARLARFTVAYFRNVLGHTDHRLLADSGPPVPSAFDDALPLVPPLSDGCLYHDPAMTVPAPFAELLDGLGAETGVAVVSDAGAGRKGFSPVRVLDTIAAVKALTGRAGAVVWLNPAPVAQWPRTTAGRVARHVTMHPLTLDGMYRAVDVLRGRQAQVERPL
jgi:uncharacterized protein with von Willebrand factor type A (vWA) domain